MGEKNGAIWVKNQWVKFLFFLSMKFESLQKRMTKSANLSNRANFTDSLQTELVLEWLPLEWFLSCRELINRARFLIGCQRSWGSLKMARFENSPWHKELAVHPCLWALNSHLCAADSHDAGSRVTFSLHFLVRVALQWSEKRLW